MLGKTLAYLSTWDARLFETIFDRRGLRAVDRAFVWLSRSADGPIYACLAAALMVARVPGAGSCVAVLLLAFLLELPAYHVLKTRLKRGRPGVPYAVQPPDAYSFPSGHSAAATLTAVVLATFYPVAATLVSAWAAGVMISRVYNGVHFPADVLAGAGLGWGCAQAALWVVR